VRTAIDGVDAAIVRALVHHAERLEPEDSVMVLRQMLEVERRPPRRAR